MLSSVGGRGFPTIVAMDHNGKVLARLAGRRNISGFTKMMKTANDTLKELKDLEAKAKSGKPEAVNALLAKQIELGRVDLAMAEKMLEQKGISAANKKKLGGIVAEAKVNEIVKTVTRDPKSQLAAGAKFAKLIEKGFEFPEGSAKLNAYYFASMHAKETKNVELMTKCVEIFAASKNIRPQFIEGLKKDLEKMKKDQ